MRTKKIILKGRDSITSGNIIIPIDITTDTTIKSITEKGMKRRNPILKALFSSLIIKAGISAQQGVFSGVVGGLILPISRNSTVNKIGDSPS
jgi:hypothetical protein